MIAWDTKTDASFKSRRYATGLSKECLKQRQNHKMKAQDDFQW